MICVREALSAVWSWAWIPVLWVLLYPTTIIVGVLIGPDLYWWSSLVLVPLVVIPITYRMLVGGGCSLRFQICALVKGMLAGAVMLVLTSAVDALVWQALLPIVGWTPMASGLSDMIAQVWFFSGIIGGMGARIVEVRAYNEERPITIAGFEDPHK